MRCTTIAIRGKKEVKIVFILGLALISCVANGALDHLGSRRLLTNVCTFDVTTFGVKPGLGCKHANLLLQRRLLFHMNVCDVTSGFTRAMQEPCKYVTFEIIGTLKADTDVNVYTERTWSQFEEIEGFEIIGPGTLDSGVAEDLSRKTYSMHISTSCNVKVLNSKLSTGDDCVSIGQGDSDIHVSHIECGPGHGISVGSLGKYSDETDVNRVLVTDCKLTGTSNGARIKTWLASPSLKASSITYQNIVMDMVKNPIIIDQEYGAQKPETAVNFVCSKKIPCCVELADVDLVYKGGEKDPPKQECVNAKVTFAGKQNPAACRY
ncbi:hypothetical protein Ddye_017022 [Dipteronia dyeriana]|uniref:Polygalacturonase n=1 Tax=Dipteronia dyeriana TaxID=168575 RepID=A0AAD9X0M8_9ROSI|nr:hypothetical protein Ddye_017022 [Dipteronia dyeriana]